MFSKWRKEKSRRDDGIKKEVEKLNFSYKWIISDFSWKCGNHIESPVFRIGNNDKSWHVTMAPYSDYLSVYLVLASPLRFKGVAVKFQVSILDENGGKVNVCSMKQAHSFTIFSFFSGWMNFVKKDYIFNEAARLLPNDTLTILCEGAMMSSVNSASASGHITDNIKVSECQCHPFVNLETLLDSGKFSDVTISVGGKEFQAHKAILSARSPVFAAMFDSEMEENKSNKVEITDIDPDAVQEMLKYIYTGNISNRAEIAVDLLIAADKYSIEKLKLQCEDSVCEQICTENAAETMIVADRVNANKLKKKTISFIVNHVTQVMETSGWKSMVKSHPQLLEEAFSTLSKAFCQTKR